MTNLDAIANLFRIEKITVLDSCLECKQGKIWARKPPNAQVMEVICCAGCFTQSHAVQRLVAGPAAYENCNVAILMDLSIDPTIIMQIDKMVKSENAKSNISLGEVFAEYPDSREVLTTVMETLREAAKCWNEPIRLYTALLRTCIVLLAAMSWAKEKSIPTIIARG